MIYEKKCQKCQADTPHGVTNISRAKGVKLRCLFCNYVSQRYVNLNTLKELKGGYKVKNEM